MHPFLVLISMLHGLFGAKHRIWGEIALPDGSSPSSTGQLWCGAPDACLFCLAVAVAFLRAPTVVQTVFGFWMFLFFGAWSNIARIAVSFLCNLRGRQAKGRMMLVKVKELWCRVACNHTVLRTAKELEEQEQEEAAMLSPVEQPKTHKGMWFDGQPQGLGHAYLTPAHCCVKTGQYMNGNLDHGRLLASFNMNYLAHLTREGHQLIDSRNSAGMLGRHYAVPMSCSHINVSFVMSLISFHQQKNKWYDICNWRHGIQ